MPDWNLTIDGPELNRRLDKVVEPIKLNSDTEVSNILWGTTLSVSKDGKLTEAIGTGSYYGRNIMIMGDSTARQNNWINPFKNLVLPNNVDVIAVDGARWLDSDGTILDGNPNEENTVNNTLSNQIQKIKNNIGSYKIPDIVFIFAGVNDAYLTSPISYDNIESFFTTGETTDTNSYIDIDIIDRKQFPAAIRYVVENLRNLYPVTQIVIITPLETSTGWVLNIMLSSIRDIILRTADRLSVTTIDLYASSGIYGRYETRGANGRYLRDGLHTNDDGGMLIATKIYDGVASLSFPYRQVNPFENALQNGALTSGATPWTTASSGAQANLAATGGIMTATLASSYGWSLLQVLQTDVLYITGHIYYLRYKAKSDLFMRDDFAARCIIPDTAMSNLGRVTTKTDDWSVVSAVTTATSAYDRFVMVTQFTAAPGQIGTATVQYTEPTVINLTEIYGAGLEPSQQHMDAIFDFGDVINE